MSGQSRHYDVEQSMFRKENIYKTQKLRVDWNSRFGKQYKLADARIDAFDDEARRKKMILDVVPQHVPGEGLVLPVINYPMRKESETMRLIRLQRSYQKQYGNQNPNISYMKAVDQDTRESLYDGLAHEQEGRHQYLDVRKRIIPENRFDKQMTSSWEYGWNLGPRMSSYRTPKHGRLRMIHQSFYRNNKVFNPTPESAGLSMAM